MNQLKKHVSIWDLRHCAGPAGCFPALALWMFGVHLQYLLPEKVWHKALLLWDLFTLTCIC